MENGLAGLQINEASTERGVGLYAWIWSFRAESLRCIDVVYDFKVITR